MNESIVQCRHPNIKQSFCMRCGIYYEQKIKVYGIKNHFLNKQGLGSENIIDNLRANQFDLSRNKDYSSLSQQILDSFTQIIEICSSLNTSFQTKILATYIFWHTLNDNKSFKRKDLLLSIFMALTYQQTFIVRRNYRLVREMVLNPMFESGEISERQLIYEEMQKLQKINFKLKLVTFVDFLEFYIVSGVMFSNEIKRSSDYDKIIHFIDLQIQRYVNKGLFFTEPNQQYLALKILYHARQKCGGIDEIWNWHIEYITKTKKRMIDKIINERKALAEIKEGNLKIIVSQTLQKYQKPQQQIESRQKSASVMNKIYSSGRKITIR